MSPPVVCRKLIKDTIYKYTSEILSQGGVHHCVSRSLNQDDITLKRSVESDTCQNHWTFLTQRLPLVTEVTSLILFCARESKIPPMLYSSYSAVFEQVVLLVWPQYRSKG